ncbi:spore coat polysaccharide biosynthesis protein F, CMP-KDO synthetase [Thermoplasmatales archaeon SCGC AB-540-F20]|nr:spore coat polysaccharide biosynthesis protein F, CMP-KDO synthetase [Thermoplasmatales archaeon SCGC AB-540-F20]
MKIGILITVRLESKRLPGKVLKKINGKEIAKYIYERLQQSNINDDNIIFATSDEKSDDLIEKFCLNNSYHCFRGPKDNVALRLLNCAKHFDFDAFVRINGDNVFTDKDVLNEMIKIFKNNECDFVTNVPGRTFPYGVSVEIIRTSFYENIYPEITKPSDREHVTKYIYENIEKFNVYKYQSSKRKYHGVKVALDTKTDFEIISKIINCFRKDHLEYTIEDIVDLYCSITGNVKS